MEWDAKKKDADYADCADFGVIIDGMRNLSNILIAGRSKALKLLLPIRSELPLIAQICFLSRKSETDSKKRDTYEILHL